MKKYSNKAMSVHVVNAPWITRQLGQSPVDKHLVNGLSTIRLVSRSAALSNPKPGHTTGGVGRGGAQWGGGAWRSGVKRCAKGGAAASRASRRYPPTFSARAQKTAVSEGLFGSASKRNPM